MLGYRVLPPRHVPQDSCCGRERSDIGFLAGLGSYGFGRTAGRREVDNEAIEPFAVVGRTVARHADDALVRAADLGAGVLDGARAIVGRDLHLLEGIQRPPQPLAQLSGKGRLHGAHLVLVQAYCEGYPHRCAREVPAGVAVVRVVEVHGGQHHCLHGHDA